MKHLSPAFWPAEIGRYGNVPLIDLSFDWLLSGRYRYVSGKLSLLGLSWSLTWFIDGYADDDPAEIELTDDAMVTMRVSEWKRMRDELERLKADGK